MNNSMKSFFATLLVLAFLPFGIVAAADKNNPVKERQKMMRSVGKAMSTTVKMVRGAIPYDAAIVTENMKMMNEVANKYSGLFPKGSDMENSVMDFDRESDARPQIWTNMDDFKMRADVLKQASAAAMTVAGDRGAMGSALGKLGSACKGCHEKYKADKK